VLLAKLDARCNPEAFSNNLAFWSWKRPVPPTDAQLDWFERYFGCQEIQPESTGRRGRKDKEDTEVQNLGLKHLKEFYRRQYDLWVKERDSAEKGKAKENDRPQSFTDRIAGLLSDEEGGGRTSRRRR